MHTESKRVGLLTLPLSDNFGGLLQIVALYAAVIEEGGDPWLIDKNRPRTLTREIVARVLENLPGQNIKGLRAQAKAVRRHRDFLATYLPNRTRRVHTGQQISGEVQRLGLTHAMVGSDQVWRREYQGDGNELNYFLDFGPPQMKRISYAASFGHSEWKYPELTARVTSLVGNFDALSVRERSGVDICSQIFGRADASHVLDPTLLHDRAFYDAMLARPANPAEVLVYTLDRKDEARAIASQVGSNIVMTSPHDEDISVPQWVGRIASADFVVTDSFHGTAFAIIFGKPFLTLMNAKRGGDRFTSLLGLLGLEHRLVSDVEQARALPRTIDYAPVMEKLLPLRAQSRAFLQQAISL